MKSLNHVPFAVEVYGNDGPTGVFRAVLEAKLCDFGGNTLCGPGDVSDMNDARYRWRVPNKLVATKLGDVVESSDVLCDYAE